MRRPPALRQGQPKAAPTRTVGVGSYRSLVEWSEADQEDREGRRGTARCSAVRAPAYIFNRAATSKYSPVRVANGLGKSRALGLHYLRR